MASEIDFTKKQSVESFQHIVTEKSVMFWRPPSFGNWTICPFEMHNHKFNCAEQAMMWCKAQLFGDEEIAKVILATLDPKEHKDLRRKVQGFVQSIWDEKCLGIMTDVLMHKFSQNQDYAVELLKTGSKVLVECSPMDKIWGIGMNAKQFIKIGEDVTKYKGTNLLGHALMAARESLRSKVLEESDCSTIITFKTQDQ